MRRFLFIVAYFILFSVEGFSAGETPQQLVGSLDEPLKGVKKNLVDSLKVELSGRYVDEYRTYGRKLAYDSLVHRIRVIKAANEHNTSDTLASVRRVEQPLSEIDRLKKENQTLRNELKMLRFGETPEKELTQLQKRTRWIVKQLLLQNNAAADTLYKVYNDKSFGRGPVCFDSISTRALMPNMPKYVKPRYLMAKKYPVRKTHFEELCQRNDVRNLMNEKVTFLLVGRNPAAFDFVRLGEYDDQRSLVEKKITNVRRVEVDGSSDLNVSDVKKPKANAPKEEGPWVTTATLDLQFTQCYISKNWYKGGNDYATLMGEGSFERNYKEGKKIWDNKLETKVGFYTSSVLEDHAIRVYNDVFKISSTMGYNYFDSKLYPAIYGEFNTQLFRSYKNYKAKETEKTTVATSFMSPTRLFLGAGAKYEFKKDDIFAYLSPLTSKLLFVVNDDIEDVRTVGIEDTTKKAQVNLGIFGKGKVKWAFSKDISISSEFDIFAPYNFKNVEFNWNTVGSFKINNYLRTKLTLNMRFDSTPVYEENESPKLQILEQLGFGFIYTFNQ